MTARGELEIVRDARALAHALARRFVDLGRAAIAQRGSFHVALSGGSTPRAAYELLGVDPLRAELSWRNVVVYFGDERCVPPDDDESNYRMARRAFLDAVGIPPANVHRIRGEIDPREAASEYAATLRADLGYSPEFDLVLLGLGPDGHTASLFPGTPPETDAGALVRAVYAESQSMWRVTITPAVINAARTVIFAVEGREKAAILAAVYDGPVDTRTYPAQIVRPEPGRLVWMVDAAAASRLDGQGA